ncbi:MAG: hypothetical protein K2M73_02370 [Lachnospiraceae bacterium]|nr:hypothetical protein [Lachnospiraceae bacterium]
MSQDNIPITEFDSLVSPKELNIIKASLPYLNSNGQSFLSIYVKLRELINTMKLVENEDKLSICSMNNGERKNISCLIDDIKVYLDKNELDTINTYMNTINTISMYNEYMSVFSSFDDGGSENNDE